VVLIAVIVAGAFSGAASWATCTELEAELKPLLSNVLSAGFVVVLLAIILGERLVRLFDTVV